MSRRTALVHMTAASVVAVALSACSSPSTPAPGQSATPTSGATAPSATAPAMAGRAGDVMFAQMMIPHHQQAVEMADIALGKPSASPKVRELATQIKAAQDPEIAQMTDWLKAWGASTATSSGMGHGMDQGMGSAGMMSDVDLNALKAAQGADFDRRWLTGMIAHHQGAVMMANQVLGTTSDPQVKALAEAIVKAQTSEITTMQGLL